jgi:hypothetical protein
MLHISPDQPNRKPTAKARTGYHLARIFGAVSRFARQLLSMYQIRTESA